MGVKFNTWALHLFVVRFLMCSLISCLIGVFCLVLFVTRGLCSEEAADWWSDSNKTLEWNKPLVLGHMMRRGALTNQRDCLCVNHRANAWNFEHISPIILPGFTTGSLWPRAREQELSRIDFYFLFSGSSTKANKAKSRHSIIGRIVLWKVKLGKIMLLFTANTKLLFPRSFVC